MRKTKTVRIGDRVRYSRNFLRSTGMLTGAIPFARGTVREVWNFSPGGTCVATIEWDGGGDIPARVNVANLSIIGELESV